VQIVLTMTPGGQAMGQSLGFTAATVVVDNFTSSYVQLTDVGKTIPPWTYGAVVPLPDGIRQADATLAPTVPAIPGPPVPKVQAVLTWTDQALPADPGHLLQQVTTQQETVLGTVHAGAGASATKDFAIPAGTLAVGYVAYTGAGLSTAAAVTITGDQTGVQYFLVASAAGSDGLQSVPVDATDTSVTVLLDQTSSGSAATIDVLAWPVVPVVVVRQNKGALPIGVFLERSDGVAIDVENPAVNQYELGVSLFRATAPSYLKRPYDAIADSGEPGAGVQAVATIAGVVSKRQTAGMIRGELVQNAGAAGVIRLRLRDGASGVGAILQSWTVGIPATAGASMVIELSGLAIRGTAGNAMTLEFSAGFAAAFESCGLGVWQD
jgi:hypothetical protein